MYIACTSQLIANLVFQITRDRQAGSCYCSSLASPSTLSLLLVWACIYPAWSDLLDRWGIDHCLVLWRRRELATACPMRWSWVLSLIVQILCCHSDEHISFWPRSPKDGKWLQLSKDRCLVMYPLHACRVCFFWMHGGSTTSRIQYRDVTDINAWLETSDS